MTTRSKIISRGGPRGTAEELDIVDAYLAELDPIRAEQDALRATIHPELVRLHGLEVAAQQRFAERLDALPPEHRSVRRRARRAVEEPAA